MIERLGTWEDVAQHVIVRLAPEMARQLCIEICGCQPTVDTQKAIRVISELFDEGQNGERKDVRSEEA